MCVCKLANRVSKTLLLRSKSEVNHCEGRNTNVGQISEYHEVLTRQRREKPEKQERLGME